MAVKVLGKWGEDGAVTEWPDVDVFGAPYDRPANTYALDRTTFVVLPQRPLRDGELATALEPILEARKAETPPTSGPGRGAPTKTRPAEEN